MLLRLRITGIWQIQPLGLCGVATFSGNPGNLNKSGNSKNDDQKKVGEKLEIAKSWGRVGEESLDLSCRKTFLLFQQLLMRLFLFLGENYSLHFYRRSFIGATFRLFPVCQRLEKSVNLFCLWIGNPCITKALIKFCATPFLVSDRILSLSVIIFFRVWNCK